MSAKVLTRLTLILGVIVIIYIMYFKYINNK